MKKLNFKRLITARKNKKDENNKLSFTLPCKVGDTVYRINKDAEEPITEMIVKEIKVIYTHRNYRAVFFYCEGVADKPNYTPEEYVAYCKKNTYSLTDEGETWFIDKAKAQHALKIAKCGDKDD